MFALLLAGHSNTKIYTARAVFQFLHYHDTHISGTCVSKSENYYDATIYTPYYTPSTQKRDTKIVIVLKLKGVKSHVELDAEAINSIFGH